MSGTEPGTSHLRAVCYHCIISSTPNIFVIKPFFSLSQTFPSAAENVGFDGPTPRCTQIPHWHLSNLHPVMRLGCSGSQASLSAAPGRRAGVEWKPGYKVKRLRPLHFSERYGTPSYSLKKVHEILTHSSKGSLWLLWREPVWKAVKAETKSYYKNQTSSGGGGALIWIYTLPCTGHGFKPPLPTPAGGKVCGWWSQDCRCLFFSLPPSTQFLSIK